MPNSREGHKNHKYLSAEDSITSVSLWCCPRNKNICDSAVIVEDDCVSTGLFLWSLSDSGFTLTELGCWRQLPDSCLSVAGDAVLITVACMYSETYNSFSCLFLQLLPPHTSNNTQTMLRQTDIQPPTVGWTLCYLVSCTDTADSHAPAWTWEFLERSHQHRKGLYNPTRNIYDLYNCLHEYWSTWQYVETPVCVANHINIASQS